MSPPVFYDPATTWKEEYKRRPGERVALRDGTVLKPNQRFEDPAYCASKGKKQAKNVATVSSFMLPGLDGALGRVRPSATDPDVIVVEDRHGGLAVYDTERRLALDDSGEEGKTAAQMGAVIAGERARISRKNVRGELSGQFAEAYDAAVKSPTAPNLVRACDCFMVWAKQEGVYPGFAAEELLPHLDALNAADARGGTPDGAAHDAFDASALLTPERARLTRAALAEGPAIVSELIASGKLSAGDTAEDHARDLIERVGRFARDLAAYERLVAQDVTSARADLDLAKHALTRLLVDGQTPGSDGAPERGAA